MFLNVHDNTLCARVSTRNKFIYASIFMQVVHMQVKEHILQIPMAFIYILFISLLTF